MDLFLNLLLLAAGVAVLVRSADWFTDAAVETARRFRIPEIIVGGTLVSLATTLPEFSVSFAATLKGKVDITVGNAVGSTICNIGLILGLCTLVSPIGISRAGFLKSGLGLILLGGVFAALGWVYPDGSRVTGIVMVVCLAAYLGNVGWSTLRDRRAGGEAVVAPRMTPARTTLLFVAGAAGVVVGSKLMVSAAEEIALTLGVSKLVVSLTLVALGTSTPELVVSLAGIIKKHRALSVGNIIGANILNLAWVIGACSLVRPLPLQRQTIMFDIPASMFLSVLLLVFGLTDSRFSRREGAVLLAGYAAYIAITFTVFAAGP